MTSKFPPCVAVLWCSYNRSVTDQFVTLWGGGWCGDNMEMIIIMTIIPVMITGCLHPHHTLPNTRPSITNCNQMSHTQHMQRGFSQWMSNIQLKNIDHCETVLTDQCCHEFEKKYFDIFCIMCLKLYFLKMNIAGNFLWENFLKE